MQDEPTTTTRSDRPPAPGDRRRWRTAGAALATTCALLALVGCGGADAPTEAGAGGEDVLAGSGQDPAAMGEDLAAYQECLAEHGVELPGPDRMGAPAQGQAPTEEELPEGGPGAGGGAPGGLPEGVDADAFAEAQEACADLAPEGGPGMVGGPGGGAGGEQLQAYLGCLEEQGVQVEQPSDAPTSDADGSGSGRPPEGGLDQLDESDPAVAACADLRPELPTGAPGQAGDQSDGQSGGQTSGQTSGSSGASGDAAGQGADAS